VTRTAVLPAEPGKVWEAVGSPERLSRWLGVQVDVDIRPGGKGTVREPDGAVRWVVVEEVEPGARLTFHWWPSNPDEASTVVIDLEPVEGGTLVRVTESLAAWTIVEGVTPPLAMAAT